MKEMLYAVRCLKSNVICSAVFEIKMKSKFIEKRLLIKHNQSFHRSQRM